MRRTRSREVHLALIAASPVASAGGVRGQNAQELSNSGGGQWAGRKTATLCEYVGVARRGEPVLVTAGELNPHFSPAQELPGTDCCLATFWGNGRVLCVRGSP